MYILIFVVETGLEISTSFHQTAQQARDAMLQSILDVTEYETLEEVIDAADEGFCGFSDDCAWAQTLNHGEAQWKIVKIPNNPSDNGISHLSQD